MIEINVIYNGFRMYIQYVYNVFLNNMFMKTQNCFAVSNRQTVIYKKGSWSMNHERFDHMYKVYKILFLLIFIN